MAAVFHMCRLSQLIRLFRQRKAVKATGFSFVTQACKAVGA